ncbi:MAG TPA: hypothetical protein VGS11_10815 [Candidatus Bathyarchaeia archaeon]|nr:hypothetical protein [Candidatus Bathyarchaeia archaeon]
MSLVVAGGIFAYNGSLLQVLAGTVTAMLGLFVVIFSFGPPGQHLIQTIIRDRWLIFFLTLIPLIVIFIEYDLRQGGSFGTFKFGGIVLEHEGFAVGMIGAATFFKTSLLKHIVIGVGFAFIVSEAYINFLVDFINNSFGITISGLLGFLVTYTFFRAAGLLERKEKGGVRDYVASVIE